MPRPRGRHFPGKPLPPNRIRYVSIPGDKKRQYFDRDTGQVVSRYYAENSIARAAGFRNLQEYYDLAGNYGYGFELGGLQGLRGKSVQRSIHLLQSWEDDHGYARGSAVWRNPDAVRHLRAFMLTPFTDKRLQLQNLAYALDDLGLRAYNPRLLPGESPTPQTR